MPSGYTRQSVAAIVNGLDVTAPPLNAEYNALAGAFNETTGHNHDGTVGGGSKIDLVNSVDGYLPASNGGTGAKNNLAAVAAPLGTNDSVEGYGIGSTWVDATGKKIYVCLDATAGSAKWHALPAITPTGTLAVAANTSITGSLFVDNGIDANAKKFTNLAAPTADGDAATKLYVDGKIAAVLAAAPAALDTLDELAAALGDDPNYAATVSTQLGQKLAKAGGTMTGDILMGGFKVSGLATPTADTDAVRLKYVTDLFGNMSTASASAAKAQDWADKAEDLEVEAGKYSAKHHATKAAASAAAAATFDPSTYLAKSDNLASLTNKATARTNLSVKSGAEVDAAIKAATEWQIKTAAYTAKASEKIAADVSGAAWTLTLPATPTAGQAVQVAVIAGDPTVNNLTVAGNGKNVVGEATFVIDKANVTVDLIFDGTDWEFA